MMRKIGALAGLALVILISTWFVGDSLSADTTSPGSVNDPLASKSYVDLKVAELKQSIANLTGQTSISIEPIESANNVVGPTMDEVKAYVEDKLASFVVATGSQSNLEPTSIDPNEGETSALLFTVVEVVKGQKLICGASAEVILRSGSATVVAGVNGDGLADLTDGNDLKAGDSVPAQHHLLIARDDGRGLFVTSEGTAYIMVKGAYTIQ